MYRLEINELVKKLNSDLENGLNEEGVKKSQENYGENLFSPASKKSFIKRFLNALKDGMIIILLIALLITIFVNIVNFLRGEHVDIIESLGILFAILLSVTITLIMEGRASRAFDELNKIKEQILVKVLRNGVIKELFKSDLVVGDIVYLETGNKISADIRLFEGEELKCDESSLTGESYPVKKNPSLFFSKDTSLAERKNMVYYGTYVVEGYGKGIVVAVGDKTEFGKIASELKKEVHSETPLQEKLGKLGKRISIIGASFALLIFVIQITKLFIFGEVTFQSIGQSFIASIVLIVASVPEGLPTIVAVTLALNIIKMARENALVKKLVACETVGSVNVICSDKTGTITENKMTVISLNQGYKKIGLMNLKDVDLIRNFTLNSTSEIAKEVTNDKTHYKFMGNPTEGSLLVLCDKNNINYSERRRESKVIKVFPFSSETKKMSTVIENGQIKYIYLKGSPEKILEKCSHVNIDGSILAIDTHIELIKKEIESLQKKSMRTLGFAHREVCKSEEIELLSRDELEKNLIFDGFVGIMDPVRKEVYKAVKDCNDAGVEIKILTGDNIVTASAIANELGIIGKDDLIYSASDIEKMDDKELGENIDKIRVIARSTPLVKLRIVNLLKERRNVVAVTGDGVNDAPAIKNADIGIAMGITGTEVSKEASDIVLLDDSFTTITKAIKWGRGIYENIQKFIQFQLTANFSAVVVVIFASIFGSAVPFTALQLLWINIIMDGPPAVTLGLERVNSSVMKKKPIERDKSIISSRMIINIAIVGGYIIFIYFLLSITGILNMFPDSHSTIIYSIFVFSLLFNAINCREIDNRSSLKGLFQNKGLIVTLICVSLLQILVVQFAGALLNTTPLNFIEWIFVLGVSGTVLLIGELWKLIRRRRFTRR